MLRALSRSRLPLLRAMSSSAPVVAPATSISLTSTEEAFVNHLDEFASNYQPPIECRIAGGWLLNLPSHDLDVALSNPSGYAFAEAFAQYLHAKGVATGSVGRVAANPEQSKHLETGTTRIMGMECDFVGLRSETYTESRIPDEVKLGTPLEDAMRRDLTVNSLFFNVHSRTIEDWTQHGLSDLEQRIARTPLPPRQTFLDDPLRILRCVRFASRFNLSIESHIREAIAEDDIRTALKQKVSKERIGIEMTKMLQKTPLAAMTLIEDLKLHASIFMTPVEPPHPRSDALAATQILTEVVARSNGALKASEPLWLAAAVCPFRDAIVPEKKPVPAVSWVISDCLKLSTDHKLAVTHLFEAASMLNPEMEGRSRIGMTLKHVSVKPWDQSIVWAVVDRILPTWNGKWTVAHTAELAKWLAWHDKIVALGLPKSIEEPPLIDGKSLAKLLDTKPGPLFQVILRSINEWQLEYPEKSREDCEAWVLGEWNGEGRAKWESEVPAPVSKNKAKKRKGE